MDQSCFKSKTTEDISENENKVFSIKEETKLLNINAIKSLVKIENSIVLSQIEVNLLDKNFDLKFSLVREEE